MRTHPTHPTQRKESRQDRLAASSLWTRFGVALVLSLPWLLALPYALFGVQGAPLVGLGALIGALAGNSFRERHFLRLPGSSRRKVIAVQRSGEPSGDRALDLIAFDRLQRAARAARSDRVLIPILTVVYVVTPVVAAVRDSGWWLLCLVPAAVVAAVLPASWPRQDAGLRHGRPLRELQGPQVP